MTVVIFKRLVSRMSELVPIEWRRTVVGLLLFAAVSGLIASPAATAQSGPAGIIYDSSFGTMTFSGGGFSLIGSYGDTGVVEGVLEGHEFSGQWGDVSASFFCGEEAGPLGTFFWGEAQFSFSQDWSEFSGSWGRCGGGLQGDWFGQAIGGLSDPTTTTTTAPETTPVVEEDPTPEPEPPTNCRVHGRVADIDNNPVPDVAVELFFGRGSPDQTFTDADGRYTFAEVGTFNSSDLDFDPSLDPITVRFELTSSDGAYAVHHGDRNEVAVLRVGEMFLSELSDDCAVDVGPNTTPPSAESVSGTNNLTEWGKLLRTYRNIGRAKRYSEDVLGIVWDYPDQLVVTAFCSVTNGGPCQHKAGAAWDGPQYGKATKQPSIFFKNWVLNVYNDGPTNVEYHEVGHHILMEGLSNALPFHPPGTGEHTNHGGIYLNETSNDALIEGFAEFFATQVRRDLDGVNTWWIYPVQGAEKNLERNYAAWDQPREELAFAGILVDLVDGPEDYVGLASRVVDISDVFPGPVSNGTNSVVVAVQNDLSISVSNAVVFVTFDDGRSDLALLQGERFEGQPEIVAAGETGLAYFALPAGLSIADINRVEVNPAWTDDDSIQVTAREVWDALQFTPFPTDPNYPHPDTVARVYDSFLFAFGGDRDSDGVDDVDQIFINHGYFNDTAGGASNRAYDRGELIGGSGYIDQQFKGQTLSNPNREAPALLPIERAQFEVGTDGAAAFVEILFPETPGLSYAYESRPDAEGFIGVALPGPESGAIVRVSATAPDWQPIVLDELDMVTFWADHQGDLDQQFLSFEGELVSPAMDIEQLRSDGGGFGVSIWLIIAAAVGVGVSGFAILGRVHAPGAAIAMGESDPRPAAEGHAVPKAEPVGQSWQHAPPPHQPDGSAQDPPEPPPDPGSQGQWWNG